MIQSWTRHIIDNLKVNKDAKCLIAVSGGVDSIVLADIFSKSDFVFALVHCNFSLRGKESDADQALVQSLGKKYGVEVISKTFDTLNYASDHGISTQMAARDLRYEWFNELLTVLNYDYLATAHHANDQIETVLFNLVKGTGISGLRGIKPNRDRYIRPMLPFKKSEILDYAESNKLKWREDESNASTKYTRNLIRHDVVPVLKKINPDFEKTMQITTEKIKGVETIFQKHIAQITDELLEKKGDFIYLDKEKLKSTLEPVLILSELLKPFGYNYIQSKNIIAALNAASGKQFYSNTHELTLDRKFIILNKFEDEFTAHKISEAQSNVILGDVQFVLKKKKVANYKITKDSSVAALDLDTLRFPLELRSWKEGDWFVPLGMKGKKKLSDFMIDEKIPLNLKRRLLVLTSGESIVWVVGHRIDDRYKISAKTTDVFEVTMFKP